MGEQVDARRCCRHSGEVARDAGADHGERDRADELDRSHRREWEVLDRDVETRVHDREDRAQSEDQQLPLGAKEEEPAPRPPPQRKDHGCRRDPEPGDAEDLDAGEQKDGERGPEVVEDRTPDEVGLRPHGLRARATCGSSRDRDGRAVGVAGDEGILPGRLVPRHIESKVLDSMLEMNDGVSSLAAANLPRLDDTDRKILGELTREGRVSMAELGRRVNLSSPAVSERVQRLERAGVITGYRAEIDPRRLGYQLTAIVRVKPAPGQLPRIPELAGEIAQVGECHRITGEDCFYLTVYLHSIDELSTLLDRFLAYGDTTTSIVNASPIPRRDPPITDADQEGQFSSV